MSKVAKEENIGKTLDELTGISNNAAFHSLNSPCPNCGYCPHCGRGGYRPYISPYIPYTPSYPYIYPYVGDLPGWQGTTTISTGGNISGFTNTQSFNINQ